MRKVILMVLLAMMFCGVCSAADRYHWMDSDDKVGHFFDTQTIKFDKSWNGIISYNIIDVWFKYVYTAEGVKDVIKGREKSNLPLGSWEELSYEMVHFKFDVKNKKIAYIGFVAHNNSGMVLSSSTSSSILEWDDIIPETNGESWMKIIEEYTSSHKYGMESRSR